MKKSWKIFGLIVLILIILFVSFVIYNGYQYSKLLENSKDMGGIVFGSELFNNKLKDCSLAYGNGWKILGIENKKCIVSFIWDKEVNYEEGVIKNNWVSCSLPYEIYNEVSKIEWGVLIKGIYCNK